jgi:transposase-like protein
MLIERRVEVDHSTIYCWVQYYAPKLLEKLKWHWKPKLELSWRVDCHC